MGVTSLVQAPLSITSPIIMSPNDTQFSDSSAALALELGGQVYCTSTKCINNEYLFNAVLGLAVVIQNAVAFFKLISFTNKTITNSRILKSFFTLILKRATYAFILSFFLALRVFSLFLLWCSSLLLRV